MMMELEATETSVVPDDGINIAIGSETFRVSSLAERAVCTSRDELARLSLVASNDPPFDQYVDPVVTRYDRHVLTKDEFEAAVAVMRSAYESRWTPAVVERANAEIAALESFRDSEMDIQCADRPGIVYLIGGPPGLYKIGSTENVGCRLRQLQTASAFPLSILCSFSAADMLWLERALHHKYRSRREHGEWFSLTLDDLREFRLIRRLFVDRS
jgi:hypothetical protein